MERASPGAARHSRSSAPPRALQTPKHGPPQPSTHLLFLLQHHLARGRERVRLGSGAHARAGRAAHPHGRRRRGGCGRRRHEEGGRGLAVCGKRVARVEAAGQLGHATHAGATPTAQPACARTRRGRPRRCTHHFLQSELVLLGCSSGESMKHGGTVWQLQDGPAWQPHQRSAASPQHAASGHPPAGAGLRAEVASASSLPAAPMAAPMDTQGPAEAAAGEPTGSCRQQRRRRRAGAQWVREQGCCSDRPKYMHSNAWRQHS